MKTKAVIGRLDYGESAGRMTVVVDQGGISSGTNKQKLAETVHTKNLSQRLFDRMDWPNAVRFSPDFPLEITSIEYAIDFERGEHGEAVVLVCYRFRDGTEGKLEDLAREFPSPTLRAALAMMAGPVDGMRRAHRAEIERRTRRERARASKSNRPW